MKTTISKPISIILGGLVLTMSWLGPAHAEIKRHLVIYGGIKDAAISQIAADTDLLIAGTIREDQVDRLKAIRPSLKVFKYHHPWGLRESYAGWETARRNPAWFARDRTSGERMIVPRRRIYLMRFDNPAWRKFKAAQITRDTPRSFDGVFIDDCWNAFSPKFVTENSGQKAQPETEFILKWPQHVKQLLQTVQETYDKPIFINGAHSIYQDHVDGFMMEGFIHANWQKDRDRRPSVDSVRQLLKAQRLLRLGKPVFFQSGAQGDSDASQASLFNLCLASYLLISNSSSAFNYHPNQSYALKYLHQAKAYDIDLGPPEDPIVPQMESPRPPNLLTNGNFTDGLKGWSVLAGAPRHDPGEGTDPGAAFLEGIGVNGNGDLIASPLIPVDGNQSYTVALFGKTDQNLSSGIHSYRRLGLQVRFYDRDKQQLERRFGFTFDAGRNDWLPYEIDCVSPSKAAFIQLRTGFIGDGVGQGWVDQIYLGPSVVRERVFRRDFLNGAVWVNFGNRKVSIDSGSVGSNSSSGRLTLAPASGHIHAD